MKLIKTENAVGLVLCHDITQIIQGVTKDARFRKGHIVKEEDIPVLLSLGKDNLYVWENDDTMYHENEAAQILCDVCINENMEPTPVKEGKIELKAACDGLFVIDVERLNEINDIDQIMIASRHTFTPVVVEKLQKYGIETTDIVIVNDDIDNIKNAILELKEKGCELIITTGGMSVDPDDKTPGAIKQTGANVISYGAPVLPGAMFCLAYFEDGTPILGLPGCVMYAKSTIFDLMLPRVAAKVPVTRKDITMLGHGGLCLGCAECRYPACSFGKA